MKVLVVDIGGSSAKIKLQGREPLKFRTGKKLTPERFIWELKLLTDGWNYDRVSIGFPGVVKHNRVLIEPENLGPGWVGFDFAKALKKRTRVMNDAAMQALGSAHKAGISLFLGLGTGLGVALVVEGHVVPTELGEAHVELVNKKARKRDGPKRWIAAVKSAIDDFDRNLHPDEIVIGGGGVKQLQPFRKHFPHRAIREGDNDRAFLGGLRMWSRSA
ncbi:MAG: ROK family protein [Myxococcaceae bacterium]|nr:ROK family protein [Myxococcaceae bacterium]